MKTVKDLFKISKGKKAVESTDVTDLRYIQIDDLRNDNQLKYAVFDQKNVVCDENDVLIAWDGANAGTIGYGLKGVIGSTIAKLTPKVKGINNSYAGRFLQAKFQYLRENCTGATIPHISRPVLECLHIPLPPLEEQKKIAAILDAANALRQKDKALIAKYEELTQFLFLDMFGDPVTNSKGWEKENLESLIAKIENGWSPNCKDHSREFEEEWAVLKLGAVTYKVFNPNENKALPDEVTPKPENEVKRGDLLISRKNTKELVGACAYVLKDVKKLMLPDTIFRLKYDDEKCNPLFLWFLFNEVNFSKRVRNLATGSAGSMPNISKSKLLKLKLVSPPITLQNQFAERVQQIEKQKQLAQQSLQKSEELFNSLLQRAFIKGELTKTLEPV